MNEDYFTFEIEKARTEEDRIRLTVDEWYKQVDGTMGYSCEMFLLTTGEIKDLYELLQEWLRANTNLIGND